ncbi:lysylphosphatidylglycerol synthase domain-containing protein [Microbacterium sp. CFBP9034]|uniref:lysylphosphatidylglycerol synthase domain-containing protein n=1 Tax=Microbacterium sp. CFBP9034 TaxID=3096540 RepID=UPI002A6A13CD|nr:lysylphosphatidylglycerol synthase domain-containing protein [Microbacterium sp. CFBP9034]MDY0909004.1 lysylphosphatidylglycerol synthase domain-containing protein [Microbacterium sp. CFBP9034]
MADAPTPRWTKRALRWGLTVLVLGVVGYFFAVSLWDNWDQIAAEHLAFDWLWVVATLLFAVAVPLTGILWGRIVRALDRDAEGRISHAEAIAVQCASWLLKYIPGQVGSVVNKIVWAGKKGVSRSLVLITFVYENVFLQIASIVPSVIILLVSLGPEIFGENATLLLLPLLILIPLAAISYKPFFHRIVSVPARRVLKRDVPAEYFLSTWQTLWALVEFLGPRVLNGVGFVMIAATVTEVTPDQWLPFAAAYVLAGAIGILAFFVPSGLGVREAIIVLILSQYIPVAEAIVISLLARLLSTVGDGLIALIYVGVRRTIPKEYRP